MGTAPAARLLALTSPPQPAMLHVPSSQRVTSPSRRSSTFSPRSPSLLPSSPALSHPQPAPSRHPHSSVSSLALGQCFMCGGPHVLRDCGTVLVYARAHRITRHGRYVLFSDQSIVCRHHVTGLLQTTIDERCGSSLMSSFPACPAVPSAVSQVDSPSNRSPHQSSVVPDPVSPGSSMLQCAPRSDDESTRATFATMANHGKATQRGNGVQQEDDLIKGPCGSISQGRKVCEPHATRNDPKPPAVNATKDLFARLLDTIVPDVTINDLCEISPTFGSDLVDYLEAQEASTSRPTPSTAALSTTLTSRPISTAASLMRENTSFNSCQEQYSVHTTRAGIGEENGRKKGENHDKSLADMEKQKPVHVLSRGIDDKPQGVTAEELSQWMAGIDLKKMPYGLPCAAQSCLRHLAA